MTKIEWTNDTWNPVVGCSVTSPGCTNCYAMRMAARLEAMGQPIYQGLTKQTKAGAVWTGKVEMSNWGQVIKPLSWKKPRRIFVNSMSDLFHEALPDEAIDTVFAVMALAPQHTFQVLTKRADRMRAYMRGLDERHTLDGNMQLSPKAAILSALVARGHNLTIEQISAPAPWPLPNVWLGVSVEDQTRADERIPYLLQTPAAVRFLSCEPLLGPVNLSRIPFPNGLVECNGGQLPALDWVIVGGESGPGARIFDIQWARDIIEQCKAAGVACFVKQIGPKPTMPHANGCNVTTVVMRDRKGGDMAEWPEDLRIREFPEVRS